MRQDDTDECYDKRCTGLYGSALGTVGPGCGNGGGRESRMTSWNKLSISQKEGWMPQRLRQAEGTTCAKAQRKERSKGDWSLQVELEL